MSAVVSDKAKEESKKKKKEYSYSDTAATGLGTTGAGLGGFALLGELGVINMAPAMLPLLGVGGPAAIAVIAAFIVVAALLTKVAGVSANAASDSHHRSVENEFNSESHKAWQKRVAEEKANKEAVSKT